MRTDLGRFFEGRPLAMIHVLQAIYDVGSGAGPDVAVWIEGREMVFSKGEPAGRGFLRVTPAQTFATIAFPKGQQILDPKKRAKGPPGSQTRMTISHPSEIDLYVRRMIDAAYQLEG